MMPDRRTLFSRFTEAIIMDPGLLPHLEWCILNMHSETLEALYRLTRWLTLDEIQKVVTALEAFRAVLEKDSRLIRFGKIEKRLLECAGRGDMSDETLSEDLGIGKTQLRRVRDGIREKLFFTDGARLFASRAGFIQLHHYPFARFEERLSPEELEALRRISKGELDDEICGALRVSAGRLEAVKEAVSLKTGCYFLIPFLRSDLPAMIAPEIDHDSI